MRIRNKIHEAINKMPAGALALLYDQIKALENLEGNVQKKETGKKRYSLEQVHKLTGISGESWSDDVVDGREDRI
jgi:hypothetical protein